MNNPYEILELEPSATEEQIKTAFSYLQKKYHPDNYEDGPLKDLAVEKTEEITKAFDQIMNERRLKNAANGQVGPSVTTTASGESADCNNTSQQTYYGTSDYSAIRQMLRQNRLVEAEQQLDQISQESRNAEWYFLKGSVFFARGWMEQAADFFSTAARMEPGNAEYRAALNRVNWQKQGNFGSPQAGPYRQPQAGYGCGMCDMCTGLLCADCCCECMGGDLISCC